MLRFNVAVLSAVLFSILSPGLGARSPQEKVARPSTQVLFEMTTLNWSAYSSDNCDRALNLRLYADGKIEYEQCRRETSRNFASLVRKESRVQQKDIDELLKLIENSGFLESYGAVSSGLNLVDAGWNTTLTYYAHGREKRLEVRNYMPDSKRIPEWLHKIMSKARSLIPQHK